MRVHVGDIVVAATAAKSVHKRSRIREYDNELSADELSDDELDRVRRHVHDDSEAGVLAAVLSSDECFLQKAERVGLAPAHERRATASQEARDYAPYRGAHRDAVAELLVDAAEQGWTRYLVSPGNAAVLRRDYLRERQARALWMELESEPDATDAIRVRERTDRLREGAKYVARFGARRCITCDAKLAFENGVRARRTHCSLHEAQLSDSVRASQLEAMRDVLDAHSLQRRRRRAARRSSRPDQTTSTPRVS